MKKMIVFLLLCCSTLSAAERPVTADDAKAIFEKLKSFSGTWKKKSTAGWTGSTTYDVAAKGSVVLSRFRFEGEPNDGMITTFFLDGDRLLLTHYCEAKNQPTLVASTIDDETRTVYFRFHSGTNMASRDVGHMDSCAIRFIDDDHVSQKWTWYSKGKETWMEAVESERVRGRM